MSSSLHASASSLLESEYDIVEGVLTSTELQSSTQNRQDKLDWEGLRKRSLSPGGFGNERIHIWPQLLNVDQDFAASLELNRIQGRQEDEGIELEDDIPKTESINDQPHPDERQIKLDTDRSFVLYPVGSNHERDGLQHGLHNLLVSLLRKRRTLSYFQGYHDIITVLFLTMPPELRLPCAEKLSLHRVRDSMGSGLEPVLGLLRVTKNLLKLVDAKYAELLEQSSPLPFYALSNLLTLFAHDMPTLPLIQHVFDFLLCRPPISVVYLATAIILSRKDEVIRLEEEGEDGMIHSLLSSLPNIQDSVEESERRDGQAENPEVEDAGSVEMRVPLDIQEHDSIQLESEEGAVLGAEVSTASAGSPSTQPRVMEDSAAASMFSNAVDVKGEHFQSSPRNIASGSPTIPATSDFPPSTPEPSEVQQIAEEEGQEAVVEYLPSPIKIPSRTPREPSQHPHLQDGSSGRKSEIDLDPDPSKQSAIPEYHLQIDVISHTPSPPPSYSQGHLHPHIISRPKTTLSELLIRADELYETYPPTRPEIALASIMGPQSVIFTWSESGLASSSFNGRAGEDIEDLIDPDTKAENMLLHPELVVYPFTPEPNSKEREETKERASAFANAQDASRKKRKRNKLLKHRPLDSKTKALVAGAIIVLGVAMAVYGVRAQRGSRGGFGFGIGKREFQGKWVGPALVGAGMKLVDMLGLGLGGDAGTGGGTVEL